MSATTNGIAVPQEVWAEVRRHFGRLVQQCRDCLYGTPVRCGRTQCPAWRYRPLAAKVAAVAAPNRNLARHYVLEQSILDALFRAGRPITVKSLRIHGYTRWEKSHAVRRLVASGSIVRVRGADGRKFVSLPSAVADGGTGKTGGQQ